MGERAEPPMRILTLLAPTASVTALLVITISLSVSPAGAGPLLSPGCLLGRARGSVLLPENESPGCGNLQQVRCHHLESHAVSQTCMRCLTMFDNTV